LLREKSQKAEYARALGITLYGYVAHLAKSGRISNDTPPFQAAQDMFESLHLPPDDDLAARHEYAQFMTNLGYARARGERNADSILAFDLASKMWHDLAVRTGRVQYLAAEATALRILSTRRRQSGDLAGALADSQLATRCAEQALNA
jgi:hypothetical protein